MSLNINVELSNYINLDNDFIFRSLLKNLKEHLSVDCSYISFIDSKKTLIKIGEGINEKLFDKERTPCNIALKKDKEDCLLSKELSFLDDPFKNFKFYNGLSIKNEKDETVGFLCLLNEEEKVLSKEEKKIFLKTKSEIEKFLLKERENKILKDNNENYLKVNALTKTGFWELDLLTGKTVWSKEVYDIHALSYDIPTDKIMGLSYYPEKDRKILEKYLNELIENGKPFGEEFNFIDEKGVEKKVIATGEAFLKDGKVVKIIGTFQDITQYKELEIKLEREKEEKDLAMSKLKYKSDILDESINEIFIFDCKTLRFSYVNKEALKNIRYSLEEMLTMTPVDIKPEYTMDSFLKAIKPLNKNEVSNITFETEHKRKDGTSYFAHIKLQKGLYEGKDSYIAFIWDISDKKINEQVLKQTNESLDLALNGARLGIWDWYLQDNSVRFDERWMEMLGLDIKTTPMELKTWESRVHPDDIENAYSDIKKYMNGEVNFYENTHRMKHADGHWVYILDRGKFSDWDDNGNPIRFTGTHFDITELKMRELVDNFVLEIKDQYFKMKEDRSEFYNYLLKKIIKFTDSEFGMINRLENEGESNFLRSFAISNISWDDKSAKFYNENFKNGFTFYNLDNLLGQTVKSQKPLIFNKEIEHKKVKFLPSGFPKMTSFLNVPLIASGKVVGIIALANGDYSKKQLNFCNKIFSSVAEILEYDTLQENLEKNKEIMRHQAKLASIGELASGVGHEINNPLLIVKGYSELLLKNIKEDNYCKENFSKKIETIINSSNRIKNIVAGLKVFARKEDIKKEVFNFSEILNDSVNMLYEMYKNDGININLVNTNELYVNGNIGKLQQVIVNLINNAKDSLMNEKEKKIKVELKTFDGFVSLKIKDSGCGISEENLNKIFQPFFTTKEINEGTGIGLSIVHGIVKEHEGEIKVESKLGLGTTFEILLPKRSKNELVVKENVDKPELGNKKTILFVDDEEGIREYMFEVLKDYGYDVELAENGEEGLIKFKEDSKKFDIIISDSKMPKMNGEKFFNEVRKIDNDIEFIISSGCVEELDFTNGDKSLKKPIQVMKPFDFNEVDSLIRKLTNN